MKFNQKGSRQFLLSQKGVSLVEILVGIVLVTVISLTTLNYFVYGKGGIRKQGHRRAALERARERLEKLMAVGITQIEPPMNNISQHWASCTGSTCTISASSISETVSVDDHPSQRIESTVQWVDDLSANTGTTPDALELGVKVWFSPDLVDDDAHRVHLRTLRAPS